MKKRIVIATFSFGFLLAGFFLLKLQAKVVSQLDYSISAGNNPNQAAQYLGNGWQNNGQYKFQFKTNINPINNYRVDLYYNCSNQICAGGGTIRYGQGGVWNGITPLGNDTYEVDYGTLSDLDPSKYLLINFLNGGQTLYGSNSLYQNLNFCYSWNTYTCTPDSNVATLWFQFTDSGVYIENSATIPTIPDLTATNQFNFDYLYHLDSAAQFQGYFSIFPYFNLYYCNPTCVVPVSFGWYDSRPNSNIATGTIIGGIIANGTYQIKNFYLKYDSTGNGNLNASTSMVDSNQFLVSASTTTIPIITIPVMPTGATSTLQIITCDPNDAWYAYSFCKLALWLFIPDQNVLSLFGGLINNIKDKAPIGYFSSISTALNQVGSTSTPAVIIFNTTSTDPVNTTFFSPIRTALIWILWLAFGFWIFERFRHFNLTNP